MLLFRKYHYLCFGKKQITFRFIKSKPSFDFHYEIKQAAIAVDKDL